MSRRPCDLIERFDSFKKQFFVKPHLTPDAFIKIRLDEPEHCGVCKFTVEVMMKATKKAAGKGATKGEGK